jgi:hypothetical protein
MQWYVDRMRQLTSVFTIDIASYAIMSNHYHLVLFIDQDVANALSHRPIKA